jgi:hypothetical protein
MDAKRGVAETCHPDVVASVASSALSKLSPNFLLNRDRSLLSTRIFDIENPRSTESGGSNDKIQLSDALVPGNLPFHHVRMQIIKQPCLDLTTFIVKAIFLCAVT